MVDFPYFQSGLRLVIPLYVSFIHLVKSQTKNTLNTRSTRSTFDVRHLTHVFQPGKQLFCTPWSCQDASQSPPEPPSSVVVKWTAWLQRPLLHWRQRHLPALLWLCWCPLEEEEEVEVEEEEEEDDGCSQKNHSCDRSSMMLIITISSLSISELVFLHAD